MTEVVINDCFGGFGISDEAAETLRDEYGWTVTRWEDGTYADPNAELIDTEAGPDGRDRAIGNRYSFVQSRRDEWLRCQPDLVEIVKRDDIDADGEHSALKVVEVPDDVEWEIKEYDGNEWVAEKHRTWG
jgi:hypothetical protein